MNINTKNVNKYSLYEKQKRQLDEKNLPPEKYIAELRKILRRLGI